MVVSPHPEDLQGFTRGGWNVTYIIHLSGPDRTDKWFLVILFSELIAIEGECDRPSDGPRRVHHSRDSDVGQRT